MNTITLLGTKKRIVVNRFENEMVVMEGISDKMNFDMEQEQRKYGKASFKSFNHNVPTYDVLLFGKINFKDKKDTKLLKKFESRLWDVADISHFVYTNLDYETGTVHKKENDDVFKGYQTMDIITWLKQCHVVIGKPQYICIYKYPRGKFQFHCPDIYKQ